MTRYWISLALLAVAVPSRAVVYTGNPSLMFHVQRPANDITDGEVDVTKVRLHDCIGGGYTDYPINVADVDVVGGYTKPISPGNLCGVTFYWGSSMVLEGDDGDPFEVECSPGTTYMALATPIVPVTISACSIVSGTPSGAGPKVYAVIN